VVHAISVPAADRRPAHDAVAMHAVRRPVRRQPARP